MNQFGDKTMTRLLTSLIIFFLTLFPAYTLFGQSQPGNYQKVTYYHLDKENLDSFTNNVEEWKAVHQAQINSSEKLAWRLYRVPFSSNTNTRYNFVTVEISTDLNSLQSPDRNTIKSIREDIDHQMNLSYAVNSEIWLTEEMVYGAEAPPSRYVNANFMYATPLRIDEYLDLESEIAKPLHQNQADNNRMSGWNFNRLVFPTGTILDYNFITTDFYRNLEQIEMGITREIIMDVHPDMDVDEFENFADSIRKRVWSDLWELVKYAD